MTDTGQKRRSGEWPVTPEEAMRLIVAEAAKDAAESAVHRALTAKAGEDGKRDGILQHVVEELKGLRLDLKPVLESSVRHSTILDDHKRQLSSLWNKSDENMDVLKAHAAEVAKGVIRDEMVEALKETKTAWRGVAPAIVGSVVAGIIVVLALYLMGFQKKEKEKEDTPAPTKVVAP